MSYRKVLYFQPEQYHDSQYDFCSHGNPIDKCEACDWELEQNGGIDKCLNCGKYKSGNSLNKDQVCKAGCVNPNEY